MFATTVIKGPTTMPTRLLEAGLHFLGLFGETFARGSHRAEPVRHLRHLRHRPPARIATHRALYGYVWHATSPQQIRILLMTFVIAPLVMAPLELQRRIVDDAISGGSVAMIGTYGAIYVLVVLVQGALKYGLNIHKAQVLEIVARRLRLRILEVSGDPPLSGLAQHPAKDGDAGTMVSVLVAECEDVGGFASDSFAVPTLQIATMMWVMAYMLWVQPLIALFTALLYLPQGLLVPLVQRRINRLVRMKTTRLRRLGETEIGLINRHDTRDFDRAHFIVDHVYTIRMKIYRLKYLLTFLGNFLDALGPIVILCFGGYLVIVGETSVATLVVFISGIQRLADPWDVLINFFRTVSVARVAFGMIIDVIGPDAAPGFKA